MHRTHFRTPFGCDRLRSLWDCVVGKRGSRRTSVRLRALFTSGLTHKLLARSRFKISFEMGSRNSLLVLLTAVALSAGSNAAAAKAESRPTDGRLRVIMSSDFPPIGVVKGGNVPNTMKSDPDDMQSMIRFLL